MNTSCCVMRPNGSRRLKVCAIVGTAREKASVLSFVIDDIHPHDIGTILDQEGIAVRAGHHCAQPVMQRFNIPATARASFAFYNTKEEVDVLARTIEKVVEIFSVNCRLSNGKLPILSSTRTKLRNRNIDN